MNSNTIIAYQGYKIGLVDNPPHPIGRISNFTGHWLLTKWNKMDIFKFLLGNLNRGQFFKAFWQDRVGKYAYIGG